MTAAQVLSALEAQLGIKTFPESTGSYESLAFTWDLYTVEVEAPGVGSILVDVALSEDDSTVYIVLLQATPDDHAALHESVFLPAIGALAPLSSVTAETDVYEDPDGFYAVPIPTGWTADSADGYGVLTSPEGGITAYFMSVEGEDIEEGYDNRVGVE